MSTRLAAPLANGENDPDYDDVGATLKCAARAALVGEHGRDVREQSRVLCTHRELYERKRQQDVGGMRALRDAARHILTLIGAPT